ncbi:MAG: pitrilysin family protein [Sedimentisphaerales bacterium]
MRRGLRLSNAAIFAAILLFNAGLVLSVPAKAQDLSEFEKRLTEWTLPNGLNFLVFERHEVPVVSFHTYADVGSVDEVAGNSGLAHLFEHLAFKGTKTIGTRNYQAEARAMAKMDETFEQILAERRKGDKADKVRLEKLDKQFQQAQQETKKYIIYDQFDEILTRAGGRWLNAYTGKDATQYVVSLPSNKVELWMSLESDRFMNPVLREFYKEKEVVMEERRMSENNPSRRLYEEFFAIAYKAHPYGHPGLGFMSDLENLTRGKAEAFFKKYYSPPSLTIAIVGDVNPQEVKRLAQKYFGRIPGGAKPLPVTTVEPPQLGRRRVIIEDSAQPLVIIGYHRPDINHSDNAVFEIISKILAEGRTSRLFKSLVKEKKIAVSADAYSGGSKYPDLFVFNVTPAKGHTADECENAVYAEIEKLKTETVSGEELKKAKTLCRAELIGQLESNTDLAGQLAFYQVLTGDWRNLFRQLDRINNVSAQDIQRVAAEYFITKNSSVGIIQTNAAAN